MVEDVALLREELQTEQEEWLQSAPAHVRQVYRQGAENFVLQPLVVLHLLKLFEFPGTAEIADELQFGFKVLGPLPQGTNWEVRQDAKYCRPLSRSQFEVLNSDHRPSEHSATMLQEIGKEQQRDRFQGPFDPARIAHTEGSFAARAFPVVQQDKIRRADDWRRSYHNSTVFVRDSPPYAGPQTVLNLVQSAAEFGGPILAGLDHDGAYRALPVREPEMCYVFVPDQGRPSVFKHFVLPF